MSGHSKFANIKHKKEKNDAKKGKIFTIIGREIVIAVKEGGPDPANNSKLRDVIAKAKANNMPNDTIDRGIKKAASANAIQISGTSTPSTSRHVIYIVIIPFPALPALFADGVLFFFTASLYHTIS